MAALTYRRALDKHSSLAKRYRNNNFLLYACTCTTTIIYYYYIYFFCSSLFFNMLFWKDTAKNNILEFGKNTELCANGLFSVNLTQYGKGKNHLLRALNTQLGKCFHLCARKRVCVCMCVWKREREWAWRAPKVIRKKKKNVYSWVKILKRSPLAGVFSTLFSLGCVYDFYFSTFGTLFWKFSCQCLEKLLLSRVMLGSNQKCFKYCKTK